jgi:peptide/nickel transport system permease protein
VLKYTLRKIFLSVPLIIGVITLVFVMLQMAPGEPIDRFITPDMAPEVQDNLRVKYGLDKPPIVQYGLMLRNLAVLDFGVSMTKDRPVVQLVLDALPNTLLLSGLTLLVLFPLGIAIGTVQAVRQGKPEDTAISVTSLFFYSMPRFWLALMLQLVLAYYLDLFPLDGMEDKMAFTWPEWVIIPPAMKQPFVDWIYGVGSHESIEVAQQVWRPWVWIRIKDLLWHLFLPGVAMGVASAAGTARYMRSALLEVVRQDYIRTARAKGLSETVVILKHAMRNALLPIITLLGLSLPFLFSGSVLIEYIFSWPGMGRLIVDSIFAQDTPVIIACFIVFAALVVAGNLLADLLYAVVDPRIKYD